jgi:hypothetical protein
MRSNSSPTSDGCTDDEEDPSSMPMAIAPRARPSSPGGTYLALDHDLLWGLHHERVDPVHGEDDPPAEEREGESGVSRACGVPDH